MKNASLTDCSPVSSALRRSSALALMAAALTLARVPAPIQGAPVKTALPT